MSKNMVKHFYPRILADGTTDVVVLTYNEDDDEVWLNEAYQAIGNGCDLIEPIFCTATDGTEYAVIVDEEAPYHKGCQANEKLTKALRELAVKKGDMAGALASHMIPVLLGAGFFAMVDRRSSEFIGWNSEEEARAFLSELVPM